MTVLIVGGGITGLSAAWFLKKKNPSAKIILFEQSHRLGGWIQTIREKDFLFEQGPRSFLFEKSPLLLQLIQDLGLNIIHSDRSARRRFIVHEGRLRSFSSLLPMLLPSLFKEPFLPVSQKEDESIYDFAVRRFSPQIAETFFDPLALGVYAGDIRKLSLRACFPTIHRWEQEKGSILKGFLRAPKKRQGLFTIRGGMQTLIAELEKRLCIEIQWNCSIEKIGAHEVFSSSQLWKGDQVINALPPLVPKKSLWVVNLLFPEEKRFKKGFGFLVPTKEGQSLLGVIFDSLIFPEQAPPKTLLLTAMVRAEEKNPLEAVLKALERYLGISSHPIYSSVFFAKEAIPQFEVGGKIREGISVEERIQKGLSLLK